MCLERVYANVPVSSPFGALASPVLCTDRLARFALARSPSLLVHWLSDNVSAVHNMSAVLPGACFKNSCGGKPRAARRSVKLRVICRGTSRTQPSARRWLPRHNPGFADPFVRRSTIHGDGPLFQHSRSPWRRHARFNTRVLGRRRSVTPAGHTLRSAHHGPLLNRQLLLAPTRSDRGYLGQSQRSVTLTRPAAQRSATDASQRPQSQ
jgi:hypothetical protein